MVSEMLNLHPRDIVGSLSKGRFWERISPWLEPLASRIVDNNRLPYDKLVLADFGFLWSSMIEHAHNILRPASVQPGRERGVRGPAVEAGGRVAASDPVRVAGVGGRRVGAGGGQAAQAAPVSVQLREAVRRG